MRDKNNLEPKDYITGISNTLNQSPSTEGLSKELEAIKYLKENKRKHWLDNDESNECLDIVEKAIKESEELDNVLYDILEKFGINNRKGLLKKLKAFDVILNNVDMTLVQEKHGGILNAYCLKNITQEDYNLLMGVLSCTKN